MDLRNTMWGLFKSTGNLDAYLAYRACVDPGICQSGATVEGAYYVENFSNKAMIGKDDA